VRQAGGKLNKSSPLARTMSELPWKLLEVVKLLDDRAAADLRQQEAEVLLSRMCRDFTGFIDKLFYPSESKPQDSPSDSQVIHVTSLLEELLDLSEGTVRRGMAQLNELKCSVADLERRTALLREAFPFQGYIEKTEERGISYEQLARVKNFAETHCHSWQDARDGKTMHVATLNLYNLSPWLIKPATNERNCALVELFSGIPCPPHWFCSHWWGQPIRDFVACIGHHCTVRQPCCRSTLYWVCAYANRQHSLDAEISSDPKQTSFYKPSHAFSRVWCAYELFMALIDATRQKPPLLLDTVAHTDASNLSCVRLVRFFKDSKVVFKVSKVISKVIFKVSRVIFKVILKFSMVILAVTFLLTDGLTDAEALVHDAGFPDDAKAFKTLRELSFPIHVMEHGLKLELQKAEASQDADRKHILNAVVDQPLDAEPLLKHAKYDEVNTRLRAKFAFACLRPAILTGSARRITKAISTALHADRWRRQLVLDIGKLPGERQAEAFRVFVASLPDSLSHLSLKWSNDATDSHLAALAKNLPSGLQQLELVFRQCELLTDASVAALACKLPSGLQQLTLNFAGCKLLTDGSVAALANQLPSGLLELTLNFQNSSQLTNAGVAALANKLPRGLQLLTLKFSCCGLLTDAGVAALANKLPSGLQQLTLNFDSCSQLTEAGMAALANNLPRGLQQLTLDFYGCSQLTDAGMAALANKLPRGLQQLMLDFNKCKLLTDAGVAALAHQLPSGLQELTLHFGDCRQVSRSPRDAMDSPESLRAWAVSWAVEEEIPGGRAAVEPAALWLGQEVTPASPVPCAKVSPGAPVPALPACSKGEEAAEVSENGESTEGLADGADGGKLEFAYDLSDDLLQKLPSSFEAVCSALQCATGLGKLQLGFSDCKLLTDASVAALSNKLPSSLQHLTLDFNACKLLTDASVAALANKLPSGLQQLTLCFKSCSQLTDAGVAYLANKLPSGLQQLQLDFNACKLPLNFSDCQQLTDASVAALANKLPSGLKQLTLDFRFCELLTDAGVAALADKLPSGLQQRTLNLNGCPQPQLTDAAKDAMGSPESLRAWACLPAHPGSRAVAARSAGG
ncbi:unnamed protein product, partial [Polarella glacialis]